jgi:hypothetical protein
MGDLGNVLIMGDVHGQLSKVRRILVNEAQVMDPHDRWVGGDATLCFVGDYVDRGPDGIGCIDLIMSLERQAADAGGRVIALLGNHDILFMAAYLYPNKRSSGPLRIFRRDWEASGGVASDMERLTALHLDWLRVRPAMMLIDDLLLIHADSLLYYRYGKSVEEVNQALSDVLHGDNRGAWDRLLDHFGSRFAFMDDPKDRLDRSGVERAREFLKRYGGRRIVHGHTPIPKVTDLLPEEVDRPFGYADGLCINVDAGMYSGSEGFIYRVAR